MQIVIDIPEEDYIKICDEPCTKLGLAVRNGTPLPKGHGRLIDADKELAGLKEVNYHAPKGTWLATPL